MTFIRLSMHSTFIHQKENDDSVWIQLYGIRNIDCTIGSQNFLCNTFCKCCDKDVLAGLSSMVLEWVACHCFSGDGNTSDGNTSDASDGCCGGGDTCDGGHDDNCNWIQVAKKSQANGGSEDDCLGKVIGKDSLGSGNRGMLWRGETFSWTPTSSFLSRSSSHCRFLVQMGNCPAMRGEVLLEGLVEQEGTI
jgi:hypothetical protein